MRNLIVKDLDPTAHQARRYSGLYFLAAFNRLFQNPDIAGLQNDSHPPPCKTAQRPKNRPLSLPVSKAHFLSRRAPRYGDGQEH